MRVSTLMPCLLQKVAPRQLLAVVSHLCCVPGIAAQECEPAHRQGGRCLHLHCLASTHAALKALPRIWILKLTNRLWHNEPRLGCSARVEMCLMANWGKSSKKYRNAVAILGLDAGSLPQFVALPQAGQLLGAREQTSETQQPASPHCSLLQKPSALRSCEHLQQLRTCIRDYTQRSASSAELSRIEHQTILNLQSYSQRHDAD